MIHSVGKMFSWKWFRRQCLIEIILLLVTGAILNSALAQPGDGSRVISLEVTYTADFLSNIRGGVETGTRYMDNLDVTVNLDLEKLLGWKQSTIFLYGLANQGRSISELTGDIQGVSNIDAENSWRLYEAWWQKQFPGLKASLLAGLFDTNAEFDYIHTGQLFINSSHGIGADFGISGRLGPSTFPYTSLGFRLKFSNYNGFVVKTALLDGVPSDPSNTQGTKIIFGNDDGLLALGELSFSPYNHEGQSGAPAGHMGHRAIQMNKYRLALGGWLYTANRVHWDNTGQGKSWGLYFIGENRLTRETVNSPEGLSGYVRLGITDGKINQLGGYFGTGMVYTGPFEGRNEDQFGISFAHAPNSSSYLDAMDTSGQALEKAERVIEITYQWVLGERVQLQGDLQYIMNPGTDPALDNALVTGARIYISL